jgi:hypothetical protein
MVFFQMFLCKNVFYSAIFKRLYDDGPINIQCCNFGLIVPVILSLTFIITRTSYHLSYLRLSAVFVFHFYCCIIPTISFVRTSEITTPFSTLTYPDFLSLLFTPFCSVWHFIPVGLHVYDLCYHFCKSISLSFLFLSLLIYVSDCAWMIFGWRRNKSHLESVFLWWNWNSFIS